MHYRQFEYTVLPLGLTNIPVTFQWLINATLYDKLDQTVLAYLDDILIYTDGSKEDYIQEVHEVLAELNKKGFKISPEKCTVATKEVEFLGVIVNRYGVRMDPTKVDAITEWPVPEKVKHVQEFLRLTNYYHRFIEGYARKTLALTLLLKKNTYFTWGKEQNKAF